MVDKVVPGCRKFPRQGANLPSQVLMEEMKVTSKTAAQYSQYCFVSLEWESHTSKGLLLDNVLAAASLESGLVYCNTFRFFMQKSWTSCINNSWLQCARGETRARGNCVEGKIDLQESAMVKTRVPSVPACASWYYEKHQNHYEKMTLVLAMRVQVRAPGPFKSESEGNCHIWRHIWHQQ